MVHWLAAGSGRHKRGPGAGVATTTSATGAHDRWQAGRPGRRTGAGPRCRSTGSAPTVGGVAGVLGDRGHHQEHVGQHGQGHPPVRWSGWRRRPGAPGARSSTTSRPSWTCSWPCWNRTPSARRPAGRPARWPTSWPAWPPRTPTGPRWWSSSPAAAATTPSSATAGVAAPTSSARPWPPWSDRERSAGRVAPDVPDEVAARFISVVGDGLLLQRAILGEVPHAPEVVALATATLATATGPAARPPGEGA